jgi:hypothetical protein
MNPGMIMLDAGILMAEHQKATLVFKDGQLVGIFGFKGMMLRVIAKKLRLQR